MSGSGDYISREAAIEYLTLNMGWNDEDGYPVDDWDERKAHIADLINGIPAADVRPVRRGKWNRTDAYPHRLYCSACHKTYLKNDELLERWEFPLNFCPNCGADMREEI